jgi:transposase
MSPVDQLPEDPKVLKQVISQLYGEVDELRQQVQMLLRARYGRKSESFVPGQLTLFEESETEPIAEPRDQETQAVTVKKHGRSKPSRELPRKRIVYELSPSEMNCPDCGSARKKIGEDTSEQYDYVPSSICVIEHVRCKYACSKCEGQVVIAEAPVKPIEKGLASAGMLAYIATCKYADHLPLNRLEGIFKRQGAKIARSTMCDWMAATAGILQPLYNRMRERVLNSRVVWTDDTPIKLQDRLDERNMREARIWVYIGDKENRLTVYDFTESRKRDGPKNFLAGFRGYLQADAFAGYDCIYDAGGVLEVACMAHARRKFFDCLNSNKEAATQAIEMIKELYQIEREATDLESAVRRQVRLVRSAPLLNKFKRWLDDQQLRTLPRSPLGKAVRYALNNWRALCRYLCDGELTIDNNYSERAMRSIAVGRKNWLFAGSRDGGKNAAIISSLIATCKAHNVNPQAYLLDVLTRLSQGEADMNQLLPDAWASANL